MSVTVRVLGTGVDLVNVAAFAEQMAVPGSRFSSAFTPGERADVAERGGGARHWAVRWAAKEALVKAWSAGHWGTEPLTNGNVFRFIETVTDAWGRPRIVLHGPVAAWLSGVQVDLSLSHDGRESDDEWAIAYVVLSA